MSGYDCDGPSAFVQTERRARKEHSCYACQETIRRGDRYRYMSGVWDGRGASYRHCLRCAGISDHLGEMARKHNESPPMLDLDCGHEYDEVFGCATPLWVCRMADATPDQMQALRALEVGMRRLCEATP